MEQPLLAKFPTFINKTLILCILGAFVVGGGLSYVLLQNKINSNQLVESSVGGNTEDQEDIKNIFVDISGAVSSPGVYEMAAGDRVGDVVALAGGVSSDASAVWVSKNINLSKILEDSAKIYIPFEWEFYLPEKYEISKTVNTIYASAETAGPDENNSSGDSSFDNTDVSDGGTSDTSNPGAVGDDGKLNVNEASASELDALPGIGPAYAEKIMSNRPYKDIEEFISKSGLYKSTIENIKDLITF